MATDDEHVEVPAGVIDGANTTFFTTFSYQADTLKVWHNGHLFRRDDEDGFVETNPVAGEFTMKESPLSGDTIIARYMEA